MIILFLKNKKDYDNLVNGENLNSAALDLYKFYRNKFHFTVSSLEEKSTSVFAKTVLGLTDDKIPIFLFTRKSSVNKHYDIDKYVQKNSKVDIHEIIRFINKVETGKIEKFLTFEELLKLKEIDNEEILKIAYDKEDL